MFGSGISSTVPWSRRLHSRRLFVLSQPPTLQQNSPSSQPPYNQPRPPYNQPQPPITTITTQQNPATEVITPPPSNGFDANVVMVLSVLLCALICSLGLNSIIRCALRCSSFTATDPNNNNGQNTQNNNNNLGCSRLANTGIKKKALKSFTTVSYSADLNLPALDSTCAICLYEFAAGDRVRLLPKCNHGFHVRCIDQWLNSHSSCPTCRNCLIETCQKIVDCSQPSSSQPTSLPPAVISNITPLDREPPLPLPPHDLAQEEAVINISSLESETPPLQPQQLRPHVLAHEAAAAIHMVQSEHEVPPTRDSIRVTHG